jgi:hypothetical protein
MPPPPPAAKVVDMCPGASGEPTSKVIPASGVAPSTFWKDCATGGLEIDGCVITHSCIPT